MSPHPYLADQLQKTSAFMRRFVVVGERELTAVALWNAHTYVYDCARATPYLHPYSPEPGSGKTTLLDVLELTACNAVQADNLSEAALFRMIDEAAADAALRRGRRRLRQAQLRLHRRHPPGPEQRLPEGQEGVAVRAAVA